METIEHLLKKGVVKPLRGTNKLYLEIESIEGAIQEVNLLGDTYRIDPHNIFEGVTVYCFIIPTEYLDSNYKINKLKEYSAVNVTRRKYLLEGTAGGHPCTELLSIPKIKVDGDLEEYYYFILNHTNEIGLIKWGGELEKFSRPIVEGPPELIECPRRHSDALIKLWKFNGQLNNFRTWK